MLASRHSETTDCLFCSSFAGMNSRSSISSSFLFLVVTALGEGEEAASNESEIDERGELIEDEEVMGSAGLGRDREFKVFQPLDFLTKCSSFGSSETCRFPGFRSGEIRL